MTEQRSDTERPVGAIDIGSNTIRLLVATGSCRRGALELQPVAKRVEMVRLGMGVDRTGRLEIARLARAVAVVEEFRQVALAHGAAPILAAATSAVRDAANGPAFVAEVAAVSGLDVQIVGGEREAALTFAGATLGQSLDGTLLVGDLGGGSLELITARDGTILSGVSLQLGSGRLTERHVTADPPDWAMVAAVERDACALLAPVAAASPPIGRMILVGGTGTSVLKVLADGGRTFTRPQLDAALRLLTSARVSRIARDTGLDIERVRTLAAGAAIIRILLASYGLAAITDGSGGLRQGLILEHLRRQVALA